MNFDEATEWKEGSERFLNSLYDERDTLAQQIIEAEQDFRDASEALIRAMDEAEREDER